MSAKDLIHEPIKDALIKAGWTITHDPLSLEFEDKRIYIDLGAEKLIAAEKTGQKIAVEVKSFVSNSPISDLEKALGQYILYHDILQQLEPNRRLYLAIRQETYSELFQEPVGKILLENQRLCLLVFDSEQEIILKWIP